VAWPNDRLTNYAAGVPVKSSDMNALQDAVIGGHHGEGDLYLPGNYGTGLYDATITAAYKKAGYSEATDIADTWMQPLLFLPGTTLVELEFDYDRSPGGGNISCSLRYRPFGSGSFTTVGTVSDSSSSSRTTKQLTSGLPHQVVSGRYYFAIFTFTNIGNLFWGTRVRARKE